MHLEYGDLSKEYVLEFINEAHKKGIDEIQILDHTHRFIEFEKMYEPLKKYEVQKKWLENKQMKFKDHLSDYVSLMEEIKKMDLPVKVKYGLEVCYTPESREFIKEVLKPYKFDFLVGAIHSIDGILYDMNFSKELLWDKYNVDDIYKRYYELVIDMIDSHIFSQVAHPDTIKLFNYYPSYNLKGTYNELCRHIKDANMKAENNTGCHYRYNHNDVGLSDELLKIFIDNDIDIITASDAHHPKDVGSFIKEAQEKINKLKGEKNMYNRIYNFAAGPSQLPIEVLEEINKDLFNYHGTGMSVMEMSHRSKDYLNVFNETKATLKEIMNIPDNYEILFMQGGATLEFSAIPLNLSVNGKADYIVTGSFAKKAATEAKKFTNVNIAFDAGKEFKRIPTQEELKLDPEADYVYICANNTIYGTEYQSYPETGNVPLVADMSSDICSREIDVSKFGLIYAGCQKNMGVSGLGLIIIKKDLIKPHKENIPVLLEYDTEVSNDSMYNTPNTFAIYVLGLMAKWIKNCGGIKEMEKRNIAKSNMLYEVIDNSNFYKGHADKDSRSRMNVTFNLPTEELEAKFVAEAKEIGLVSIKGHRSVGGIRASIYNAMPIEGVEKLRDFMIKFEKENA